MGEIFSCIDSVFLSDCMDDLLVYCVYASLTERFQPEVLRQRLNLMCIGPSIILITE